MSGSQEFEFKFEILGASGDRTGQNPLRKAVASAKPERLLSIYYDTPERDLRKAGLILRVRSEGSRFVMTLKSDGASPFDRGEWEREVASERPDLTLLADTPHANVLTPELADHLQPTLETFMERKTALATYRRCQLQITLDEGEVRAGDRSLPLKEYEIELASGTRADLYRYLRELPPSKHLRIGFLSKGERGFLLADGKWGVPVKGAPVRLDPKMSAGDAFAAIAHACLHQFALNQPAYHNGEQVEAVHQTRVALRRLRAAISIFKPILADRSLPKLQQEMAWLGTLLGRARDLDVLQMETILPALEREAAGPGLKELSRRIEEERALAHKALTQGLASPRLSHLLLALTLWIGDGPWRRSRDAARADLRDGPIGAFAARELGRRFGKFAGQAGKLDRLPPLKLHRERIRAKKLRYGSQFFENLATEADVDKPLKKFVRSLEEVQSALGQIQDAETRQEFLTSEARIWAAEETGDAGLLLFAAGKIAGEHPDRSALIERAAREAKKASEVKPFWEKF